VKQRDLVLLLRGELDLKMWATTVGIQAEAVEALQRIVGPTPLDRPAARLACMETHYEGAVIVEQLRVAAELPQAPAELKRGQWCARTPSFSLAKPDAVLCLDKNLLRTPEDKELMKLAIDLPTVQPQPNFGFAAHALKLCEGDQDSDSDDEGRPSRNRFESLESVKDEDSRDFIRDGKDDGVDIEFTRAERPPEPTDPLLGTGNFPVRVGGVRGASTFQRLAGPVKRVLCADETEVAGYPWRGTVDPKVHLSHERTLLAWSHSGALLAVVGVVLRGSPQPHHQVVSSVLLPTAVLLLLWSLETFLRRQRALDRLDRPRYGVPRPLFFALILAGAFFHMAYVTWHEVFSRAWPVCSTADP
jgi:uncharacterized membrane protein YidH (DUF202 family)